MTRRGVLVVALWCCALLMQSIGLLHGYVHPHGGHGARHALARQVAMPPAALQVNRADRASAAPDWLHALFAGHDSGSAGCSLFDQLTHADLLHSLPMLALAYAAPSHPDAVHAAWHHATQVTGFLARAPPALG